MTPKEILEKYWRYSMFRPLQEEIITAVLDKRDTLAILPTGGGKSICFQVPAMMLAGVCLVVTPLIALMRDQVENLRKRNISAVAIHSGLGFREVRRSLEGASKGDYKFIYVSPERLQSSQFLEYLSSLDINLIAVDEAHCISQWGYDFRPAYLKISEIREYYPDVSVLALTATATPEVQKDICDKLNFSENHRLFTGSYLRPNLSYSVFIPPAKETRITEILRNVPGTSIAYCRSRRTTKDLFLLLKSNGISADFYHAGLGHEDREKKQEQWMRGETRVICCTNAFGMGIDKPDVRTVVHYGLPDSLEYYYQEAGRAGRDGKKSYGVLLFYPHEVESLKEQIPLRFPDLRTIRNIYGAICSFIQLPAGKGRGLSFSFDIDRFIGQYKLNAIQVVSVLQLLEQESVFSMSDNMFAPSTIEFLCGRQSLDDFERDFPKYNNVIKGLLRSYENIINHPGFIDEFRLSRFIRVRKESLISDLTALDRLGIIEYIPRGDTPRLSFYSDRVAAGDLIIDMKRVELRKNAYSRRLSAMIEYATQKDVCRSVFISRYFGVEEPLPCGICDICLSKKSGSLNAAELKEIVDFIRSKDGVSLDEIRMETRLHREKIREAMSFLAQEDKIRVDISGNIRYEV